MIDLYTWTTPNGRKVSIMLEECGLPYTVHPVNIREGQQFKPEFLAGDYAIADIATYPWVAVAFDLIRGAKPEVVGAGANVARWISGIAARPAVARGMAVPQI